MTDQPNAPSAGRPPDSPQRLPDSTTTRAASSRRSKPKLRQKKRKLRAAPAKITDKLGRPFPPAKSDVAKTDGQARSYDKAGRPFAIKDIAAAVATLAGLGAIMATSKECAAVLGVSEPTLFYFFKRHPEAQDAWESGKQQGKSSLRRAQFKLAEKNATMGIFLGMQYLDQKDKRAFSGDPDNPIKHQHTATIKTAVKVDYDKLPLDELIRAHAELTAKNQG